MIYAGSLRLAAILTAVAALTASLAGCGVGAGPSFPAVVPAGTGPDSETVNTSDAVAFVNGDAISRQAWRVAVAIDAAMSELAGQPPPGAEATLDRLINERLVLRLAADSNIAVSEAFAVQRLREMQQRWGVGDARIDRALAAAGASRDDLIDELRRLIVVEAYLDKIAAREDPNEWLADQRSQARVSILDDLAAAALQSAGSYVNTAGIDSTDESVTPDVTPAAVVAEAPTAVPATASLPAPVSAGVMPGDQALDFQLADLEGKNTSLSAWRSRPVVLNFWASWCGPCQKEASEFRAFHERFRDRGVAVLGVDVKEDAQAVRDFANRYGLSYPLLLDADGSVSTAYQVRGIPTTLVLDGAGVIRVRHVGPLNADQLAAYVEPYLPAENAVTPAAPGAAVSRAPDCALPNDTGEIVRLSDYRDKQSLVLVFYRGET